MVDNPQKRELAEAVRRRISSSECVLIANLSGINGVTLTELRRNFRKSESELFVVKNTIMRFAIQNTEFQPLEALLTGENAFVISKKDVVTTAKVLYDFSNANKQLEIKGGVLNGRLMTAEQVAKLAQLPSKEQLIAKMLGSMNAPIHGFVNVLAGTIRQALYVLNAIKEKKSEN